jgi:hypothetical protein
MIFAENLANGRNRAYFPTNEMLLKVEALRSGVD